MKSETQLDKVRNWHRSFNSAVNEGPKEDLLELRASLINEESNETLEALKNLMVRDSTENRTALLKELADLLYVVHGTAAAIGWNLDIAFNRVHKSNMSKLGDNGKPMYREDGKVLKGPNYKEPFLEDLVL